MEIEREKKWRTERRWVTVELVEEGGGKRKKEGFCGQ